MLSLLLESSPSQAPSCCRIWRHKQRFASSLKRRWKLGCKSLSPWFWLFLSSLFFFALMAARSSLSCYRLSRGSGEAGSEERLTQEVDVHLQALLVMSQRLAVARRARVHCHICHVVVNVVPGQGCKEKKRGQSSQKAEASAVRSCSGGGNVQRK